jgi:hypothetical protein
VCSSDLTNQPIQRSPGGMSTNSPGNCRGNFITIIEK